MLARTLLLAFLASTAFLALTPAASAGVVQDAACNWAIAWPQGTPQVVKDLAGAAGTFECSVVTIAGGTVNSAACNWAIAWPQGTPQAVKDLAGAAGAFECAVVTILV